MTCLFGCKGNSMICVSSTSEELTVSQSLEGRDLRYVYDTCLRFSSVCSKDLFGFCSLRFWFPG